MKTSYKLSLTAIFTALALISFSLENLLPPIIVPGARIGFSNLFVLAAAVIISAPSGFCVLAVKCLLGSLLSGNPSSLIYSLPSGLIALAVQTLLIKNGFGTVILSAVGAVINSAVQTLVFCIITGAWLYLSYLPYLTLVSIASGSTIGLALYYIVGGIKGKYKNNTSYLSQKEEEEIYDNKER